MRLEVAKEAMVGGGSRGYFQKKIYKFNFVNEDSFLEQPFCKFNQIEDHRMMSFELYISLKSISMCFVTFKLRVVQK